MRPHLLPAMSRFILFIAIIIFVCGSKPVFADDDERYLNCSKTFDCGNIKDIPYPFWGSNRQDYCGYPGLELNCINQDPEITIMQSTYKVLGIDNQSRTLNVSRTDYTENLCPTLLSNTSLEQNPLEYTSDHGEVTLYYGCPAPSPQGLSARFTCTINETDMMGYFITANLSELVSIAPGLISYLTTCNNSVKVPIRQSAILPNIDITTVEQLLGVLNQGFGLEWNANDDLCEACKLSGGQCGYNQTTKAFTCYCADQPREFNCAASPPSQSTSMSSFQFLFLMAK
ncbi:unnamed protein product [Dovyalis caffra]|uniref:non-specific serine/threonine protein kinase n=1 Tax=Dovyalis caffra TaxID=77055 RepID=A0AAV1S2C7_9ROSI|nr:unnamed protein product [Dovyalis caffra]